MKTKRETKNEKTERIAHALALSWLDLSERLLKRNDPEWQPSKLSELSESAMQGATGEYSIFITWSKVNASAVAQAKQRMALFPEKWPLTLAHFARKAVVA